MSLIKKEALSTALEMTVNHMPYQVLARKWRPKNFAEMVGQPAIVRTLTNALTQERLHHAYLFTGTRGVGKTTIARIIAKCLNCETGISATPCGTCGTCQSIDAGQFVDLIEVDAASRTKVEDTRELLDNVQYAPTQGRFKIYLIDEVHMLSGHSFNALLKTLEEPPAHVKFLLATTDPQKLPITVLSRCLQFHLQAIAPEIITEHLQHILRTEKISFQEAALLQLAEAANGSLRDALSILDQAIAFSDANITSETVRELLGATASVDLYPLLDSLSENNGVTLIAHIQHLALQGVSFSQVLTDFLSLLHHISMAQVIPAAINYPDKEQLLHYATLFSKEDIQLFYQIGVLGQRDLPYTPSTRSGFEMTLLRMLCFMLDEPVTETLTKKSANVTKPSSVPPTVAHNISNNWADIVNQLHLNGMTKVLAENCVLINRTEQKVTLQIDPKHASLANDKQVKQLQAALTGYWQHEITVVITQQASDQFTPAKQTQLAKAEQLVAAKNSLVGDPHVQSILQDFGASLDETSIKSLKN